MKLHILIRSIIFLILSADAQSMMGMPSCTSKCGKLIIPYPFGIGKGCYYDESFAITCNTTFNPNKPFLRKFNIEVVEVDLYNVTITVMNPVASNCGRQQEGDTIPSDSSQQKGKGNAISSDSPQQQGNAISSSTISSSTNFSGSPYYFNLHNEFVVVGCDRAQLYNYDQEIRIDCLSNCKQNHSLCQKPLDTVMIPFYSISIEESTTTGCTYAFLGGYDLFFDNTTKQVPVVVNWGMDTDSNEYCREGFCLCPRTYTGNPYIPNGCKLAEACANCKGDCDQNQDTGQYHCGHKTEIILGSTFGGGLFFLLLCGFCFWLYKLIKKKRSTNLKKKFFKRNGGLLLEQQISSNEGTVNKTILFTSDELSKATDNYNENRILGQGGQGTVYKGMLTDGRITAVKKSKLVDESRLEQFINEVVILSQMNHRNIVKLLGCCLETEVPLLVYEFVPNGNLFDLIHNENEDFTLSWKMRLQIAMEIAGGLAYLHSSSSVPIYHRDIKSRNILLDEKFRAKISDFGTSRFITIEQTHLTTVVAGTFGYLDPEYYRSSQFTDKSDVYSFGVVLAELLTGQKPISSLIELEAERSLAARFILCAEQMRVFDIMDARVLEEAPKEKILAVSDIARRCLNLNGRKRPTMKEVLTDLEVISRAPSTLVPVSFKQDTFNIVKNKNRLDDGDYSTSTMIKSDYLAFSSSDVDPLVFYTL